ncbi:hypothetical protein [Clostridium disporicum]|uniref:BFD-like [2Fe-2S] binding domain n=1 Tax=Clostridium disporicum TaxID=84024 RepID=A0A174K9B1_9CLOT|nr:hypothetical protein [Clostridium disporicum]CUP05890.1 BFD-like [2Fe-2S] binding domain [Clostridium disporicum]
MKKHKSEKIHQVVHDNDRKLNLHEIKAETGAGNGFKSSGEQSKVPIQDTYEASSKSEKIQEAMSNSEGKINLHTIKAQTGAGNGYNNTERASEISPIKDTFVNTNKFHKIHHVVSNIEGKANLHKIKAQTGAGNGYITQEDLKDNINTPSCDSKNPEPIYGTTHKSNHIHAVIHANDRKLNLHQIKQKTGAGSGYKHQ